MVAQGQQKSRATRLNAETGVNLRNACFPISSCFKCSRTSRLNEPGAPERLGFLLTSCPFGLCRRSQKHPSVPGTQQDEGLFLYRQPGPGGGLQDQDCGEVAVVGFTFRE